MTPFNRIPLAWLQLTRNRVRFAVALSGIAFASILIFVQQGFRDSLYNGQTALHKLLDADLIMLHAKLRSMSSPRHFSRQYLYRALNLPEVENINYLYYSVGRFRYSSGSGGKGIVILGINPDNHPFVLPELDQISPQLRAQNTVLYDRGSDAKEYGDILIDLEQGQSVEATLLDKRVWVIGAIDFAGASFADDGNLLMSATTFIDVRKRNADEISLGLLKLAPGTNQEVAIARLQAQLPSNITVRSIQGFIDLEKDYWSTSAPIGFVFGVGVVIAFFVGVVIVYQVLYNEVVDHLPDYALLKAKGYKSRYFVGVLLQEALILAILGYIPGYLASLGIYELTRAATALPVFMTLSRAIFVLVLSILMCFTSGMISIRKLDSADPAELFS